MLPSVVVAQQSVADEADYGMFGEEPFPVSYGDRKKIPKKFRRKEVSYLTTENNFNLTKSAQNSP
jgi:hypothetical protein